MDDIIILDGVPHTRAPKRTEDGEQLYTLPQPDLEIRTPFTRRVESTEVTEEPILIEQRTKVPLLDAEGEHMSYVPTMPAEVTEDTGNPVMIRNDEGEEVQKVDDEGNKLYYGHVPIPGASPILCCTMEVAEVQKTDEDGNLLYWKTVEEDLVSYVSQEPLEITADDEQYIEGLELAYVYTPLPAAPADPAVSADERLNQLEQAQKELKRDMQVTGEKVDTTTGSLGDFMEFYFNQ